MLSLLDVIGQLKSVPYRRMRFITVKDNRRNHVKQMLKIGQCYDYLKRFSEKIWLVKSPKSGIHFHALIVLKEGRVKISYKKGIHTNVQEVGPSKLPFDPEFLAGRLDDAQEIYQETLDRTNNKKLAIEMGTLKLAPPSKEYQKLMRKLRKNKRNKHISDIVNYLNKNLQENPGLRLTMYEHYIIRI